MPSSLQPGTGIAGARAALLPRPQPLHTSRTQRMARTARRGITTVMLAGLDALRQRQRAGTFRLIFVSSWALTLVGWKRDSPPSLFSLTSSEHQAYKEITMRSCVIANSDVTENRSMKNATKKAVKKAAKKAAKKK